MSNAASSFPQVLLTAMRDADVAQDAAARGFIRNWRLPLPPNEAGARSLTSIDNLPILKDTALHALVASDFLRQAAGQEQADLLASMALIQPETQSRPADCAILVSAAGMERSGAVPRSDFDDILAWLYDQAILLGQTDHSFAIDVPGQAGRHLSGLERGKTSPVARSIALWQVPGIDGFTLLHVADFTAAMLIAIPDPQIIMEARAERERIREDADAQLDGHGPDNVGLIQDFHEGLDADALHAVEGQLVAALELPQARAEDMLFGAQEGAADVVFGNPVLLNDAGLGRVVPGAENAELDDLWLEPQAGLPNAPDDDIGAMFGIGAPPAVQPAQAMPLAALQAPMVYGDIPDEVNEAAVPEQVAVDAGFEIVDEEDPDAPVAEEGPQAAQPRRRAVKPFANPLPGGVFTLEYGIPVWTLKANGGEVVLRLSGQPRKRLENAPLLLELEVRGPENEEDFRVERQDFARLRDAEPVISDLIEQYAAGEAHIEPVNEPAQLEEVNGYQAA